MDMAAARAAVLAEAKRSSAARAAVSAAAKPPAQPPVFSHYFVMDFEASGHNRDSTTWEIVEFPCVVVDAATGNAVGTPFHAYVRPTAARELSSFCVEQCGITQDVVDAAAPIDVVLEDFKAWVQQTQKDLAVKDFAVLTCGDYDLKTALRSEVRNKRLPPLPSYLRQWVNVKPLFAQRYIGANARGVGMARMLQILRLPLKGRHHSGIDDCKNIANIVRHMLRDGVPLPLTGRYD
eukprot:Rhum_TRINITY_DN8346_c0_g2::Rhum_TRINITY_DN8346_c0_g2_i1::g.27422::m.27422/K18418/ERI3, PINT1; ERI1 exoribonuclease 3